MTDCAAMLAPRRRGGGRDDVALSRPRGRPVRAARAASVRDAFLAPRRDRPVRACRRDGRARPRSSRAARPSARWLARRRRRFLVRHLQPPALREGRAAARHRPRDVSHRLSRERGGAGAAVAARSPSRRALRALRLRRRTRQRLRRTDRPRRAAPPLRGGHGAESPDLRGSLSDRRGFSRGAWPTCRRRAAPRSASTGSSCSPAAPTRSRTCNGRRFSIRAAAERSRAADRAARAKRCRASSAFPASAPARRKSCARCSRARTCWR